MFFQYRYISKVEKIRNKQNLFYGVLRSSIKCSRWRHLGQKSEILGRPFPFLFTTADVINFNLLLEPVLKP